MLRGRSCECCRQRPLGFPLLSDLRSDHHDHQNSSFWFRPRFRSVFGILKIPRQADISGIRWARLSIAMVLAPT